MIVDEHESNRKQLKIKNDDDFFKHYKLKGLYGEGKWGKVYFGESIHTNVIRAVKKITRDKANVNEDNDLIAEV